ncbi:hypothetical protein HCW_07860 [Helicobacter cetorum MIT 00-7128]|uniref:DUF3972 domain-containing protein n=1 Tax=Helicobacter cetorum (strain ATCC BAA-429 / MIT 00-7128) TaxID=182217 RepID=I0EPG0_HELC0|nr:DUF3972 domain-containing protein [Helicobacter cetorum]AFI04829.1 hypothetical protein HCW_07860 [Helicobacter cetorum MIT 00-7128]
MDILNLDKVEKGLEEETTKVLDEDKQAILEDLSALAWVEVAEFSTLSGLSEERIIELVNEGKIQSKKSGSKLLIDVSSGTNALVKRVENNLVSMDMDGHALEPIFVEKTINTILGLHDKVVLAKDETIGAFKNENMFLKDALISMQEVYEEDKKTIDMMRIELEKAREEIEFMKRKYRLMWGKVSDMGSVNKK